MKLRPLAFTRCAPSPLRCAGAGTARGRTVLVALRRDAAGRELLTWALVKAAAAGNRVVALHVVAPATASTGESEEERSRASDSLASVLAAYGGYCDRNQIALELRLREGPSVKKALVAEAAASGAAHLVLGVTCNAAAAAASPGRSSAATAVARYCAKRVPPSCAVTCVSGGAVVYRRDAAAHPSSNKNHHQQPQHPLSPYGGAVAETPRRLYRRILDAAQPPSAAGDDMAIGDGRSWRHSMSAAMSALVSPRVALARSPGRFRAREPPEIGVGAGWPLRKKDIALKLPARCSEPSTASDSADPVIDEEKELPEELVSLRDKYSSKYTIFSYGELANITHGFSQERLVGKGGAGRVYRGCAGDGRELAVKVLKPSAEVVKDFVSEIEILSSVDHGNAVSLVGFCVDGGRLMLVYEYMPRGSLEDALHGGGGGEQQGKGGAGAFGWPERFRVAVGVARALEHLHGGGGDRRPVIHRDVKSSNVLLADDFQPKLCDFGLAMCAADAAAQVTGDDVAGTFGYLAPEYFMHGKVTDKMDVYAFGVVLLELISGRKPVSAGGPKGQESLVMWASSVVQGGKPMDLVDATSLPATDGDHAGEVERMALAAALCIRRAHQHRPSMSNVVKLLAGDGDAVKWARSQLGVSAAADDDGGGEQCIGDGAASPDRDSKSDIQSYIKLALLDVADDDATSVGSFDFVGANMSLEEYMKERWSRSSSFDD